MKIAKENIQDTGLNVLYNPDQPYAAAVDIVLVHGIQSHPRRAWEYESNEPTPRRPEAEEPSSGSSVRGWLKQKLRPGKKSQSKETKDKEVQSNKIKSEELKGQELTDKEVNNKEVESQETDGLGRSLSTQPLAAKTREIWTSSSEGGNKYWPLDFLPDTCPSARIIAWGYDTQVTKGYSAATQHNVFSLGKDLLFGLAGDRDKNGIRGRPIVFVAHSLGGIIVKEALRRSETDSDDEVKDILTSTTAVIFLGTPHRGSSAAQLADVVRNVASVMLRLDTNDRVLRALSGADSTELELGRESFMRLWQDHKFKVKTFQEIKPMAGVNIGFLNELVVPPWSSSLDDPREHAETINANHANMCKFKSAQDDGYRKVSTALVKFVKDAASQYHSLNDREKACLASLKFDTLESRQSQVRSAPSGTCNWLYDFDEFRAWYNREYKMLWIKGKPGSGKSVLMKSLIQRVQKERASWGYGLMADAVYGRAVAAFFFKGRNQIYYETRPAGLYRTLLYQLFKQDPYLRQRLLSEYEAKSKYGETWHDDELKELFEDIYLQGKAEIPLKRAFVFVDAVDECHEDSVGSVVKCLTTLAEKTNFSICLSSRHYPHISAPNCVEIIVEKHNGADILNYIRSNLSGAFPDRDFVVQTISKKAGGVFLWVEIVVELLNRKIDNGEPIKSTLRTLDDIPPKIEGLYKKLLQDIKAKDRETAFKIFQWVLLAAEPLTLADLRYALAFTGTDKSFNAITRSGYRDLNWEQTSASIGRDVPSSLLAWEDSQDYINDPGQFLRWLRAHARGLVEVQSGREDDTACKKLDGQVVQFIHETARTFFLTDNGFRLLDPDSPTDYNDISILHKNLLRACLNFISIRELAPTESGCLPQHLHCEGEDDRQREHWDRIVSSPPEIQTYARLPFFPFLDYTIIYLFYHYLATGQDLLPPGDIIRVLSNSNGRIWRRWRCLSEKRTLHFSWLRAIEGPGKWTLTAIQKELDKKLNLESTGGLVQYLNKSDMD